MAEHQVNKNSLLKYVDGKLNEEEAEMVEVHLLSCQACVEALDDLKAESLLRETTTRHRDIVEKVCQSDDASGIRLSLRNLGNSATSLMNEPAEILRRLMDSFKEASAVPALATTRSGAATRSEFDSALNYLMRGVPVGFSRKDDETKFSLKYMPDKAALQIRLDGGSRSGMTKMSVFKRDSQRAILEMYADSKTGTFDLPLNLLNEDISLVWSSQNRATLPA